MGEIIAKRQIMVRKYLNNQTEDGWNKLIEDIECFRGSFPISFVSRDDLASMGYDILKVTDLDMYKIADAMGDAFSETGAFWDNLESIAEHREIPKIK